MVRWRFWKRGANASGNRNELNMDQKNARMHYNQKNYQLAEPYLLRILESEPDNEWALDVHSRLMMNTNRFEDAIPLINKLLIMDGARNQLLHRLVKCLQKSCQFELAISTLTEMIHNSEIEEEGWDLLQLCLNETFEREEIDNYWIELSHLNLAFPQIDIELIRIDLQSSNLNSAAQRIQSITTAVEEIDLTNKVIGAVIQKEWNIKVVPTIIIFENGKEVKRYEPCISMRFYQKEVFDEIITRIK